MRIAAFLAAEWKPALGCTEPAAVAYAAALAAQQGQGAVLRVHLLCDARTYKNCYAVGLPNAQGKTGLLWALAIGAQLPDASLELQAFRGVTGEILARSQGLLDNLSVTVDVDPSQEHLLIDVTVTREAGLGRAVLTREHTHLARLEANGQLVSGEPEAACAITKPSPRAEVAALNIAERMRLARTLTDADRAVLQEGIALNLAIARFGLALLPPALATPMAPATTVSLAQLVGAGVHARMSGECLAVMSLAGSGNKGITVSVPVALWARAAGHSESAIEEALALACLMTSATTYQLGTLSAMCGAANAGAIGIASALVVLGGGDGHQVGLAINNIVGSLAGMICDGAKVGCAMKAMTGVDTAFRAAHLALAGFGVPASDGIVGADGDTTLANLGRLAQRGMVAVDAEVLEIMQGKLARDH